MISFWQERNVHDGCLPEYRTALGMICLSSEVMGTSTYARTVKALEGVYSSEGGLVGRWVGRWCGLLYFRVCWCGCSSHVCIFRLHRHLFACVFGLLTHADRM
jgi:hypothetical protein